MESEQEEKRKKQMSTYAKYSSMVFQMIVVIGLGAWAGMKLDEYFKTKFLWTLILLFVSIFGGMYWAVKDFLRKK